MKNCKRACYLTTDGKYYCYEVWDPNANRIVTQRLEVGKDLSMELSIVLAGFDHEADLKDRYESEWRDPLFDKKATRSTETDANGTADSMDQIADKAGSPEDMLFAEPETENPQVMAVRRVIDEQCSEPQQTLFFEHFGMGTQLEDLRQAEAARTGKLPSAQAFTNRKNKIIDKAAKALGVERIKRINFLKKAES